MGESSRRRHRTDTAPEAEAVITEPTMEEMRAAEQLSKLGGWLVQLYPLMQEVSASKQHLQRLKTQEEAARTTLAGVSADCHHQMAEQTRLQADVEAMRTSMRDGLASEMAVAKQALLDTMHAEVAQERATEQRKVERLQSQQTTLQAAIQEATEQSVMVMAQLDVLRATRAQLLGEIQEASDG